MIGRVDRGVDRGVLAVIGTDGNGVGMTDRCQCNHAGNGQRQRQHIRDHDLSPRQVSLQADGEIQATKATPACLSNQM